MAQRVDLFDGGGRLVRTFPIGHRGIGEHELVWDGKDAAGRDLPAGAYFLTLQAGGVRATSGVILLQ